MTEITIPTLETARLILRAPRLDDFERYAEIFTSERSKYMGGPHDRDRAWLEFTADMAGWILMGYGYWTVADKVSDDLLGAVGFTGPPRFPERELGWMVMAEAEGHGIAFEAAAAAQAHAFTSWGWPSFVSYIDPPNARSIRLAERLGAVLDETADRPDPTDLVYRHLPPEAHA